jgi:hypothetical protein
MAGQCFVGSHAPGAGSEEESAHRQPARREQASESQGAPVSRGSPGAESSEQSGPKDEGWGSA